MVRTDCGVIRESAPQTTQGGDTGEDICVSSSIKASVTPVHLLTAVIN